MNPVGLQAAIILLHKIKQRKNKNKIWTPVIWVRTTCWGREQVHSYVCVFPAVYYSLCYICVQIINMHVERLVNQNGQDNL